MKRLWMALLVSVVLVSGPVTAALAEEVIPPAAA